jgi:hypothetical protein
MAVGAVAGPPPEQRMSVGHSLGHFIIGNKIKCRNIDTRTSNGIANGMLFRIPRRGDMTAICRFVARIIRKLLFFEALESSLATNRTNRVMTHIAASINESMSIWELASQ